MWIPLREAAQRTGKPERTLRHYAAMGKIRVKKEGRQWVCDPSSLKKYGFKDISIQEEEPQKNNAPQDQSVENEEGPLSKAFDQKQNKKSRARKLGDLGVYRELFALFKTIGPDKKYSYKQLHRALHCLGVGFYEYNLEKKQHFFRLARIAVVRALVFSQVYEELGNEKQLQIEESLLPGMSGLIRKMEKIKRGTN